MVKQLSTPAKKLTEPIFIQHAARHTATAAV